MALAVAFSCVPSEADILNLIQVTWDGGVGANRWDYSYIPATKFEKFEYIEITEMDGIVGATVEQAPDPYANVHDTEWLSTYTDTSVRWEKIAGRGRHENEEYAYFSYWSDWGGPGSLRPYYRDGAYQGDVTAAPEPGTIALFVIGLAGFGARLRRRKRG